jgi:hypothetical protein
MLKRLGDLGKDTDQAIAITGAAYLDRSLEILLKARFVPLEKDERERLFNGSKGGIISTFNSKIHLAHAIELIVKTTYADLLTINDIRNVFAHTLHPISFENDLVVQDCANLHIEGYAPPQGAKDRYLNRIYSLYSELRSPVEFQEGERKVLQDRLTLLSKSRAELAEIVPTLKAASEGLKRNIKVEGSPYGSAFGALSEPIHKADHIVERVYPGANAFPRSLQFIPASSAPAPGEEDVPGVPGEGRRLAIRKAHEAVPYISRLIRDASAKMIAEEESIKAELQNRWLSFENAKRRSERRWY